MEGYEGEGPKWRIEHASAGSATCTRADCKRKKIKIGKGELRIGTHTLFDGNGEHRWYMAWRHWRCGTPHQIRGLKEVTENDPAKAPGYDRLSPEAQEQVKLAFDEGKIADKEFVGLDTDRAKTAKRYNGEITNAESYKVDVAKSGSATCRNSNCPENGVKIPKGELRLGFYVDYDGDHSSWMYKHWRCISALDIENVMDRYHHELLDGVDQLPESYSEAVEDTMESGELVVPELIASLAAKKTKAKTNKGATEANAEEPILEMEVTNGEDSEKAKPMKKGKKRAARDSGDDSEAGYVPRKTGRRAAAAVEDEGI